ncbi:hypothetical protein V2K05_18415 [Pseudomonas alliivorans]|nr:hypothetical protein [Pseudomonas alliivorans]MEE4963579.1 hypothetical protein [Pseudomonas alliivorans]MEE4973968.1 hypothetical protein [Pseudomonas alliivorans]MEE4978744.1 hypothetical protein [Pseudomonas alliivorans]MEE4983988.1 hypothetical protein [Pseudomonas alliivorans]
MIATTRRPTSIGGIKKLAKELKAGSKSTHFQALNLAAQLAGFHNFNHAKSSLNAPTSALLNAPKYKVTISARWRDWDGCKGRVSVTVSIPKPLHQLVSPQSFFGLLSGLEANGPEGLSFANILPGEGHTEMRVFTAARAIRFISVTGLVPAPTPRNALPFFKDSNGSQGRIPDGDHTRFWKDPISGHDVVTDEPYFGEDIPPLIRAHRIKWANEHKLSVGFPKWPGIHNPGYGTRMTLFSQNLDVANFVRALDEIPAPGEGYDSNLLEPDFIKNA